MLSVALAASLLSTGVNGMSGLRFPEAIENMRAEVKQYAPKSGNADDLCLNNTCCTMSSSDKCDIASFPAGESTVVLPGGETRCIYSTSTPFAFQVIPGRSDKVLFYFQGGGACWDEFSTRYGFCTTDCVPQQEVGIFNRADERNEFREHTIIHLMYCSGDVWGGDVTRDYVDSRGKPITQKGLANAQSVLDWTVRQQQIGGLASELEELVVMGCSAGSLGAQLWGNQVTSTLKWKKAAIVPDSYAGLFPKGTEGPLMEGFGFCTSGFMSDELTATCNAKQATLKDINLEFLAANPTVPRAFIQSKIDTCQMSYYMGVGVSMHKDYDADVLITPYQFYEGVNEIFEAYNTMPNFLTYLVDGPQHCFTPMSVYYTADATGPSSVGANSTVTSLFDWINKYPLASKETASTVCDGKVKKGSEVSPTDPIRNTNYCDADVYPKTYTEGY